MILTTWKIREGFKETMDRLNPSQQEDMLDLLFECSIVFARNNDDLIHHASDVQMKAIIPDALSLHVRERYQGQMPKFISARLQKGLFRRNMVEVAPSGDFKCSHHFMAVKKPKGQVPSSKEALDLMDEPLFDKSYRAVLDVSSLTSYCKQPPCVNPVWAEAMTKTVGNTSLMDICSMFYQIEIEESSRDLFCFHSSLDSNLFLRMTTLPQGFALSSQLSFVYVMSVLNSLNGIEMSITFDKFLEALKLVEEKKPISAEQYRLLPLSIRCYVDDVCVCTSDKPNSFSKLKMKDDDYFKPPTCQEDIPWKIHLSVLLFQ